MQPRIADGVVMHEEADEAFLLDPASGRYFALNKTGVVVWRALEAAADPVDALARRWPEIPEERRRRDVSSLVTRLLEAGLVVGVDG